MDLKCRTEIAWVMVLKLAKNTILGSSLRRYSNQELKKIFEVFIIEQSEFKSELS